MEPQKLKTFSFALKLLGACSVIFALLSNSAEADSCKVERTSKDAIFSENCRKNTDGSTIVNFCGIGSCLAKPGTAKPIKYKCPRRAGAPSYCVTAQAGWIAKYRTAGGKLTAASLNELEGIDKSYEAIELNVQSEADFVKFKGAIQKEGSTINEKVYFVNGQFLDKRLMCAANEELINKFVKMYIVAGAELTSVKPETNPMQEKLKNCDELDNTTKDEVHTSEAIGKVPTAKGR